MSSQEKPYARNAVDLNGKDRGNDFFQEPWSHIQDCYALLHVSYVSDSRSLLQR